MSTITTRAGKGSPLTNNEVDANFTNLNTDKAELSGAAFTGAITTTSTVDGRDVATDGSKLDGIEAGATADQTAAEIKTAYESNADTNAFTDADESKLDGIEASADVTDTTNVTAAGALMDSELTAIASVKALNQGVATTDSPTFAGLTTSADVSFGDNDKAIFGAGSDLQIYHDGSHSRIKDVGTGSLVIGADDFILQDAAGTENKIVATTDGSVTLSNNGSTKLSTTSTGIDVTGSVTATSAQDYQFTAAYNASNSTSYGYYGIKNNNVGNPFYFHVGGSERMRIDSAGNVGIGTSSPAAKLDISGVFQFFDDTTPELRIVDSDDNNYALIGYTDGTMSLSSNHGNEAGGADVMQFLTGGSERMRIDSSGNVGIGTSSPSKGLHLNFSNDLAAIRFQNTANAKVWDLTPSIPNVANSGFSLHNVTDNTVPLHVDNSGRVGIGTSSPASPTGFGSSGILHLKGGTGNDCSIVLEGLSGSGGRQEIGASGGALQFYRGAATGSMTESMRIDSSGNLLVGKTAVSTSTPGTVLRGAVSSIFVVDGSVDDQVAIFNRITNDGTILDFRKDGTTVGSIGTNVGRLSIGSGDTGVLFAGDIDAIYPANGIAARDSAIDLGVSGARFKDLYLSGTAKSQGVELEDIKAKDTSGINLQTSNGQKRVILDNSGNLLVGKTTTAFGTAGLRFAPSGAIDATISGDGSLFLNRLGTDGGIAYFYKDGTAIGIIGVANNNNMQIAGTVAAHAGMEFGTNIIYPMSGGSFQDAAVDLGYSSTRFKNIYRSGSTYSTSDRSMKQDIRDLTDAERNVAVACKGLLKVFRFIDTVEKDGDGANIHFGVIAQELAEAFEAEGLDANDYQLYKSTTYTDENDVEQTRLNVCYENLLAFIIAAI